MIIPGYKIDELLGKGGMASVYKASKQSFNRSVALKIYTPKGDSADEGFGQRFIQESQIIAKLHHSHIVQVYDVGTHENHYYISMEYLHGGNLADKIESGITLRETVNVIKQAANALEFAHRKRIVHRDIKPENMMFREDGALVLTDFGIAKELETQNHLTQTGLVIGTPKYMSPEQIRGHDVDHRTDIYALGIVFFRCLTNYLPFNGKDIVVTSFLQHSEPVPPLPQSVSCFQPIINKMLAKTASDRYQRAIEIAEALEELDRKLYDPKITNLDVAAATKLAPPTVVRSTSGNFTTKEVAHQHHKVSDKLTAVRQEAPPGKPKLQRPIIHSQEIEIDDDPVLTEISGFSSIESNDGLTFLDTIEDEALPPPKKHAKKLIWMAPVAAVLLAVPYFFSEHYRDIIKTPASATAENAAPKRDNPIDNPIKETVNPQLIQQTASENSPEQNQLTIEPSEATKVANFDNPANHMPFAEELYVSNSSEQNSDAEQLISDAPESINSVPLNELHPDNTPEPNTETIVESSQNDVVTPLLIAAETNLREWKLTKPIGDNAYEKYQQVLELEPNNIDAVAGINQIGDAYLRLADKAINEEKFDAAKNNLNAAKEITPLNTDIKTYQAKLNSAILAYEEAKAVALAAQQAERIEQLMASAAQDERAGRIRSPIGNNALEKYQQVLALDPDNTVAIEKLVDFGR